MEQPQIIVNLKGENLDSLFPVFTVVKHVRKKGVRIVTPDGNVFDKMADGPGNWQMQGQCFIKDKGEGIMGYGIIKNFDRTVFTLPEETLVGCLRLNQNPKDKYREKTPAKPESIKRLQEKMSDKR